MALTFRSARLPNGLTVLAEVDPAAHSAAIGFFVKTGARDEDPAVMGVSHFLEHMMFKGTAKRSAEEVDQEFDDIGAEHNAFTTSEMTAFWAHTLPEYLPKAEDILSDIMRPALREADFDSEKKVILEEIAMYDDYPFWVLFERAMEVFYRDNPLSHRVLGTTQTITNLSRDQMMAYFQHRYSADNTVVAMAGRLDFDVMLERLAEHCGSWQVTEARREYRPVSVQPHEFTMTSASVHQHYMLMLSEAPAADDERRYAASVLAQILGDAEGSRLYWALIEPGLAEEAQAQYDARDRAGDYLVYVSCSPENAETVARIARQQMDELVDSLTQDDLERVRSKIATSATLHSELPAGRMRRLGRIWLTLGHYRSLESELDRINAVTLDELRSVYADFPIKPVVTAHLAPQH